MARVTEWAYGAISVGTQAMGMSCFSKPKPQYLDLIAVLVLQLKVGFALQLGSHSPKVLLSLPERITNNGSK